MSRGSAKPRGKPFEPGQSGNPAGRPAGIPNKVTSETRELVGKLMGEDYFKELVGRLERKELHPMLEKFLLEHRLGKPKELIELIGDVAVSGTYDLGSATLETLKALEKLLEQIPRKSTEA